MIRGQGITLRRGARVLLAGADFTIHPGERVGVVGRNGAGKSSLFAVFEGDLEVDAGILSMPDDWRVASVQQIVEDSDRPARDFVIDGDRRLRSLQRQRAAVADDDGRAIAELETQLLDAGAWSAPARAEELLSGLGFAPAQWSQPVRLFSGGWQMRIALARALMAPSDLLLLDEPTNHLDLDAILWLERWLASYAGTVLLISHDVEFLESVCKQILHFDQGNLIRYRGGYQSFLSQRAQRLEVQQKAIERQTRETARLESFIERFRAKASKARQAQSRIKALARMQELAPLREEAGIALHLPAPETLPDPLLVLRDASAGYQSEQDAGHVVLRDLTLMIRGGDRIGILGVNGAGKSTLVKTLAGELPILAGENKSSKGLRIGYFAQHQLDVLDPASSPLQHLSAIAPDHREQELRNYLAGFGFDGDLVQQPAGPLSGGEKARLALALIAWRKPNLLLLDEPSNHLDTDTREALAEALTTYDGSVLLVSHDRHLLRSTVDQFWIVADGQVAEFEGDLDDYRQWLTARHTATQAGHDADNTAASPSSDRRARRREQALVRQQLAQQRRPLEKRIDAAEQKLEAIGERLAILEAEMTDPAFYSDDRRDSRIALLEEHGVLSKQREQIEEAWLQAQEELDALLLSYTGTTE